MDAQLVLAAAPLVTVGSLLSLFALIELVGRPVERVHGPKLVWGLALLVIVIGPLAYLWFGRISATRFEASDQLRQR